MSPRVSAHLDVAPLAMARERVLPVLPALEPLFPDGGITRGHCIGCGGPAAISAALAVVARSTRQGHWAAVAGIDGLGLRAADEVGVALERLVLVTGAAAHDPAVLAALADGFDVLVLGGADRVRGARRLQARAQARGVVTVVVGAPGGFHVDVDVHGEDIEWEGLGQGFGRLTRRRVTLRAGGRRVPGARSCSVWLPGPCGDVELAEPVVERPVHGRPALEEAV